MPGQRRQLGFRGLSHGGSPQILHAGQQGIAGFAFDQGHQAAASSPADDRVSLPITELAAKLNDPRSSFNRHGSRQTAAIFWSFSPRPAETQALPPRPPLVLALTVDPVVNRLPRDPAVLPTAELPVGPAGNLVGRPAVRQSLANVLLDPWIAQLRGPSRQPPPDVGPLLGFDRDVTERARVPLQFAIDRRAVLVKARGDFFLGELELEQLR